MNALVDPLDIAAQDAMLTDGTVIEIRPIVPSDEPALRDLYGRASAESMRRRFFS